MPSEVDNSVTKDHSNKVDNQKKCGLIPQTQDGEYRYHIGMVIKPHHIRDDCVVYGGWV